ELVHVQAALAATTKVDRTLQTREAALIHALRSRLLGVRYAPLPTITLDVRMGFVRGLQIADHSATDIATLLAIVLPHDDARLLESIRISNDAEEVIGLDAVFQEIAGEVKAPASFRRLSIGSAFANDSSDRIANDYIDEDYGVEAEDLSGV